MSKSPSTKSIIKGTIIFLLIGAFVVHYPIVAVFFIALIIFLKATGY